MTRHRNLETRVGVILAFVLTLAIMVAAILGATRVKPKCTHGEKSIAIEIDHGKVKKLIRKPASTGCVK